VAIVEGEEDIEADSIKTGKNQFNYSERAAQTFNNVLKSRGVATEPPPVVQFTATVTQWDIFDAYMTDYKKTLQDEELLKNAEKRKTGGHSGSDDPNSTKSAKEDDMVSLAL
jgi:dynein intermediate chain 1